MAATRQKRLRQFVIRLEQPGLYDRLSDESHRRSRKEGRQVPMTELVRKAIEQYLDGRVL